MNRNGSVKPLPMADTKSPPSTTHAGPGPGRHGCCLAPPALVCDGRRQVQQGQADLGVLWPEDGFEDRQRPAAEGLRLPAVPLGTGQEREIGTCHRDLEM